VRDMEVKLGRPALLPVVLESPVEMTAA
jgi:hypothetical protein